jgi:flagellar operon protein
VTAVSNPALIPPVGSDASHVGSGLPAGRSAPARAAGAPARPGAPTAATAGASGPSFASALQEATGAQPLHFSRHALERVQRRGIDLNPATLDRLGKGVERAAGKGSRDSVVLVDGNAFVVSVANRTVVTAVGSQQMKDQVFTNVDSAVIA